MRIRSSIIPAGVLLVVFMFGLVSANARPASRRDPIKQMDRNDDGKLSKREFRGPNKVFSEMDSNSDGYLTQSEMKSFRENNKDRSPSEQSRKTPEGPYPDLVIVKHDKDKTWDGNVFFVDSNRRRVVEINREGKVVWECTVPLDIGAPTCSDGSCSMDEQKGCAALISDVQLLPNDHVLVLEGGRGAFEFDRDGKIVWSYTNPTVSHDVDRLPNGNTIMACAVAERGSEFPYEDPQAIEVDREGHIVWSWHAKDEYENSRYKDIRSRDADDWTHLNSVQRLDDGNTLLSVRNWDMLIAADKDGKTAWETGGKGLIRCPHTPVMLKDGTIMVCEPIRGRVSIWDRDKKEIVWSWPETRWADTGEYLFIRAAFPLPNKNIFVIDSCGQFFEVTSGGEVVWHARTSDYKKHSRPLEKEELNREASFFNADCRGLDSFDGH